MANKSFSGCWRVRWMHLKTGKKRAGVDKRSKPIKRKWKEINEREILSAHPSSSRRRTGDWALCAIMRWCIWPNGWNKIQLLKYYNLILIFSASFFSLFTILRPDDSALGIELMKHYFSFLFTSNPSYMKLFASTSFVILYSVAEKGVFDEGPRAGVNFQFFLMEGLRPCQCDP